MKLYWLLNLSSCTSFQKLSKHCSMLIWKNFYFFFTPISHTACCFSADLRRRAVPHLQKIAAGVAGLGARLLLPVAHRRGDCHREVHRLAGHRNFLRQGFPLQSENGAAARAQDRQAWTAVHRSCLFCCALNFVWNVFRGLFLAVIFKLFFTNYPFMEGD